MSSYEVETSKLIDAIPAEDRTLCPGCSLDSSWIDKKKRAALLDNVAHREDVAEAMRDERMFLHHRINPTKEFQAGLAAECLLTRALGACLVYTPRSENE
jgi:hypothetical protein